MNIQEENNVNPKPEKNKTPFSWKDMPMMAWIAIVAFLLFACAWLFKSFKRVNVRKPTFTKKTLREPYHVDDKTFNKWILLFCVNDTFVYEEYLSKHEFTEEKYLYIIDCLGTPSDETPILNKEQIANPDGEAMGNFYRSLRKSVIKQDIIPIKIYDELRQF
jgi:hypothetical protein